MRPGLLIECVAAAILAAGAACGDEIPLRPSEPPAQDTIVEHGTAGAPNRWLTRVGRAAILSFLPPQEKRNGAAVIICPGGGYRYLTIDTEGTEIARWLNSLGITAFVLKYRLPFDPEGPRVAAGTVKQAEEFARVAIEDAALALEIVHQRAASWGVRPGAIGMMGFSAGGHLAAIVANRPGTTRPAFLALLYPGIPEDLEVAPDSPTVFIGVANDDRLTPPPASAIRYYTAARKAGVPAEIHVFMNGGHGFGIAKNRSTAARFPDLFSAWLHVVGFLD